ncbi:AMP-binding protein [Nocardioides sp. ChNu-99]|uniref:AMP-binding protein n=1 Tax=Nocardioides sp. ChNu-99 TaxID=2839897 RepID=UPI002406562A|nr:AMP-binding protein [Nocardioides sp. ChNu-99]MDF9714809.1 AMP-binding protein [Nocardioides sp. ChNu-99]
MTSTLSLAAVLAEPARRRPRHVAVVEGERRTTYEELWRDARTFAGALYARGVAPGDRVALLAPNVTEFVVAYYGILAAGAVVVPVPTLLQAEEATHLVRHSGARLLVHHEALTGVARAAAAAAGVPAHPLSGFADGARALPTYATRAPDDTAVVFYTSGTTGRPKGAVLTHLNLVLNATVNAFDANPVRSDDVVMGSLPLFHTFGQSVSLNTTFRVGATLVLQPRFDPAEALATMVRHRATLFFGVPTMFIQLLAAARDAPELPRLRDCVSGGASLPVAVLEQFEATFATSIYEGYGLSETSPSATVNQRAFGARPGTVGHAIWGVDVEVADVETTERIVLLPPGERGEVVVRGHNVFAGYLDDPAATAGAVVDGWFRTGDVGVKDAEGFVSIVDRTKDLVIRSGFNVYPREVEEVLARHDGVAQVAVVGVPDEQVGEEVVAVVVPTAPGAVDADALVEWARERLGRHKYPRRVVLVDDLPLGPTHKVLKREVRRRLAERAAAR